MAPLRRALDDAQIPYALTALEGLFQTAEARHLDDLLAAVAHPDDRSKRLAAMLTCFFDVPFARLSRVGDLPEEDGRMRLLRHLSELGRAGRYTRLFSDIVDKTGVLAREIYLRGDDDRRRTNLLHLLEVLAREARRSSPSIEALAARFHRWVTKMGKPDTDDDVQRTTEERASVSVLTMHKSKGLEAPVVFVYGGYTSSLRGSIFTLGAGRLSSGGTVLDQPTVYWGLDHLPTHVRHALQNQAAEEDQRLLYVALTRASQRVYVATALNRTYQASAKSSGGVMAPLYWRFRDHDFQTFSVTQPTQFEERLLTPVAEFAASEMAARPPSHEARDTPAPEQTAQILKQLNETVATLLAPDFELRRANDARADAAPPFVTSYTALHVRDEELEAQEPARAAEGDVENVLVTVGADDLPRGRQSGIFLHALLEHLPLPLPATSVPALLARPEILSLVHEQLRRHRLSTSFAERALELTSWALYQPVGDTNEPLHEARLRREVDFELDLSWVSEGLPAGMIVGSLDVLAQVQGRLYFVDWKSDVVAEDTDLRAYVEERYAIQRTIYSMAIAQLLVSAKPSADPATVFQEGFGGAVYVFLRRKAVVFERIDWTTLMARKDLIERRIRSAFAGESIAGRAN